MKHPSLRISAWNANGITNHIQEIILYLTTNKIDILLISETHATDRTYVKIPYYTIYFANHPDNQAHAGAAVIIRNALNHQVLQPYISSKIQSAIIKLQLSHRPVTIAAIYSPPRHTISTEEYEEYLTSLGHQFIAAGDWNAKHTTWGSRLTTAKGRNLLIAMARLNITHLSTGEPTYWPTDNNKIPDLLDFALMKGISDTYAQIENTLELASDHSAITITLSANPILKETSPKLCTKNTDWIKFGDYIDSNINQSYRLKEPHDLEETVQHWTTTIQRAAWHATPEVPTTPQTTPNVPLQIRELVAEKRRARRTWQRTRNKQDKTHLNRLTHKLRSALVETRNASFQRYTSRLTPDDRSLWKATKTRRSPTITIPPIRRVDTSWARTDPEKAQAFAHYLETVFTPLPTNDPDGEAEINDYLEASCQIGPPLKHISPKEIQQEINNTKPRKTPGYDLITGEILKHLTRKALAMLTAIFNSMLRLGSYPVQWKFAQVIMIHKSGKPDTEVTSYRPISLLPIASKIFERLLLKRIKTIAPISTLIPDHQFGFRSGHSTVQQCHRIVQYIAESIEDRKVCAAVFLDIQQAFDKVWHAGLLYKIKKKLPNQIYRLLTSYLSERSFQVRMNTAVSSVHNIKSGVPQGSVLGPFLYLIYSADLPTTDNTVLATFADDTAILSATHNPITASANLQNHINLLQQWYHKWRLTVNNDKSVQVTFTNRRTSCPHVTINNRDIPHNTEVKYLGLYLDQKLTWRTHIQKKRQQLTLRARQLSWLLGKSSQLSLENKTLIYKAVIKPIWTYGIELWGCARPSNTKILQGFQSKILRRITGAPWYVTNKTIHDDLHIPFIADEINKHAARHRTRIAGHENPLIDDLNKPHLAPRRLRKTWPADLCN
jgi:hypothetical protein